MTPLYHAATQNADNVSFATKKQFAIVDPMFDYSNIFYKVHVFSHLF